MDMYPNVMFTINDLEKIIVTKLQHNGLSCFMDQEHEGFTSEIISLCDKYELKNLCICLGKMNDERDVPLYIC